MIHPRVLAAALLAALGPGWSAAAAAATPADLEAASGRVAAAAQALEQAGGGTDRLAALAAAIPAYETALAALRDVALGAGVGERQMRTDLAARRDEIMHLAAALQGLSRTPPPVQSLHPAGPVAAARAAALIARATPALAGEAASLRDELSALDAARQLRGEALDELAGGLDRLTRARHELSADMAAAHAASDSVAASIPALQSDLLRDSASLENLAETLARVSPREAGADKPDGSMLWPVPGAARVLGFRERDAGGERRPGILLSAPPLSLVYAPADAMVRYAGPFLEYGFVTVLETDGGTVIVLAGLAQLNVRVGEPVGRGGLVGLLGGRDLGAEEYVMLPASEGGAGAEETLYIEIRNGRGPVDPAPWFGGGNG